MWALALVMQPGGLPEATPPGPNPISSVVLAAKDIATVTPDARPYTVYLWDWNPTPQRYKLWTYHYNELSTESEPAFFVKVVPGLWRLDVRDVGWDKRRQVWERLAEVDPYDHLQLRNNTLRKIEVEETWGYPDGQGGYTRNTYKKKVIKEIPQDDGNTAPASAPDLPTRELTYLIEQTHSQVPIIRADWWWYYTSIQANRKAGYYDFLGIKDRDTYFDLIGLDVKLAQRTKREVATVVAKSGISQNNRQIFRLGATDGGAWFTKDVFDDSKGQRNALNALDKDFKHNVERHLGLLPNRCIVMLLCDAQGVRQDSAPDKVGGDTSSTSNDSRIHAGQCLRCHRGSYLPIKDVARDTFSGTTPFGDVDYDDYKRKRQLYLGEYESLLHSDGAQHERALFALTGWTPKELSAAIREQWLKYADTDVTLEQAALERGVTKERLLGALQLASRKKGQVTPSLARYLKDPPRPIARDWYEEVYPQLSVVLLGYQP